MRMGRYAHKKYKQIYQKCPINISAELLKTSTATAEQTTPQT